MKPHALTVIALPHSAPGVAAACALGTALVLAGCHVRTQEYHCKLEGDRKVDFEFAMSPTLARYQGEDFTFFEERGNQRLYRHASGRELLVDLSTMQITEHAAPGAGPQTTSLPPEDPGTLPGKSPRPPGSAAPPPNPTMGPGAQLRFTHLGNPLRRWLCERYRMPGSG